LNNLIDVNLATCYQITDVGVKRLSRLTDLENLDLIFCSQITTNGLKYLERLTNLKTLNLDWRLEFQRWEMNYSLN
jgi:hypothetical protein